MVRKKTEGNEDQRRAAARQARREGTAPSALKETTGASKQRTHLPRHEPHEEKMAVKGEGKQDWQASRAATARPRGAGPEETFAGRGHRDYTEAHEQVFAALMDAQQARGGEAVYLDDVARASGLPREETRVVLHDLAAEHRLVTVLDGSDTPDLGPRFEAKPRL